MENAFFFRGRYNKKQSMNPPPSHAQVETEILIVEDSPTQALLLKGMLETQGFHVISAVNGKEALKSLAAHHPALVISDVQMPEMGGYELCRLIKSNDGSRDLPVMLLTSLSSPQDIIQGLECGADNFVVKPYEEALLMTRVRAVLANSALKSATGAGDGIAVEFSGRRYVINASRRQILNLLLSTYETAVKTNRDLIAAHEELKAAQAQLIEAEKMQSVGRLAAGVAHEVRNPLAIIEMGLAFLSAQITSEDGHVILGEMREAVRRANGVIVSLMDIASPRELGMNEMDLHEIIERALGTLQGGLVKGGIKVARSFAKGLPRSRVDAAKIEQVFVNVFGNAIHAMPKGGALSISTEAKELKQGDVEFLAGDRSGVHFREGERAIIVQVSDTGEGIAPDLLGKVFEPFFSTKPTGKGMGLGLTVARKIIETHHGMMEIRNGPRQGVTVTLRFKALPS
jgi:signal transduction histidine kinase